MPVEQERVEYRAWATNLELREPDGEPVRIVGYAAVFNQMSGDLGGFREVVAPGAFADSLADDVRALWNHDSKFILGRTTNGTLALEEDEHGLLVVIIPPDTQWARDLTVSIRRGDVTQMSFGFRVPEGGDTWETREDGTLLRTLRRVELIDVSPVTFPAYIQTSVAVRNMVTILREQVDDMGSTEDGRALVDVLGKEVNLLDMEV